MIVHQTLIHRVLKLKLSLGEGQIEVAPLSFETTELFNMRLRFTTEFYSESTKASLEGYQPQQLIELT